MTDDPTWVFDQLSASGAIQGGPPVAHVFHRDLDVFVREVLQNSHDARAGKEPVRVQFTFHSLTDEQREEFLQAISWSALSPHLEGAASEKSIASQRMSQLMDELEARPLVLLRVDDFGTTGLTGDEDDSTDNFMALCKSVLVTTEERAGRGGSHGLGKAVLWRFSAFSTVLFSSTVADGKDLRLRLFGRADLPYHSTRDPEGQWDGSGWFGLRRETARGERAESVWDSDAEPIAKGAYLLRNEADGPGTSILVAGFFEPAAEVPRPIERIAEDVLSSAARWFWPSISISPPSLQVGCEAYDGDTLLFAGEAKPGPEEAPFVEALLSTTLVNKATAIGQVAEKEIVTVVPKRTEARGKPTPEIPAQANLRITRIEEGYEGPNMDKVALVRGSGMVVQYRSPTRRPLDARPFAGVLRTGLFRGGDASDQALEMFLRAAEPPAHDQWVDWTDQIRTRYPRGAPGRLRDLWMDLGLAVVDLTGEEETDSDRGPDALAKLFPLGASGGGGHRGRFRVLFSKAKLTNSSWSASGRVTRLEEDFGPWQFDVSLWLEGETGRGEQLAISTLGLEDHPKGSKIVVGDSAGSCSVPGTVKEAVFNVASVPVDDPLVLRRTRLRVDVRPRVIREVS